MRDGQDGTPLTLTKEVQNPFAVIPFPHCERPTMEGDVDLTVSCLVSVLIINYINSRAYIA